MKAEIIIHNNPRLIGRICDIVYYDYDKKNEEIIFKAYDGQILELKSSEIRIIIEDEQERKDLMNYAIEKAVEEM